MKSTQESNQIRTNASYQMTKTAQNSVASREDAAITGGRDFSSYDKMTERLQNERIMLSKELKKKPDTKKSKPTNPLLQDTQYHKRAAQTKR